MIDTNFDIFDVSWLTWSHLAFLWLFFVLRPIPRHVFSPLIIVGFSLKKKRTILIFVGVS